MTEKKPVILVIDIGGTNFRLGLVSERLLESSTVERYKTPNFYIYEEDIIKKEIIRLIYDYFIKMSEKYDIHQIMIAFPGPVNSGGQIQGSAVIFGKPLKTEFNLKRELMDRINNIKIFITNDMTASTWRYANSCDSFCLITISSGIGNKIFSNGTVLIGEDGLAGEIGHFPVDFDEAEIACSCGWGNNHLGVIASGRGIGEIAKKLGEAKYRALFLASPLARSIDYDINNLTPEIIAVNADQGDPFSKTIIDICTKPLAKIISCFSLALYIQKFIFIGGLVLNCRYYLQSLKMNVIKHGIYNYPVDKINEMLITGENDDDQAFDRLN